MNDEQDRKFIDGGIPISSDGDDPFFFERSLPAEDAPSQDIPDRPIGINEAFEGANVDSIDSSTEAFPVFNPSLNEEDSFPQDQGTTEDQAEFITHSNNYVEYDSNNNGVNQIPKPSAGEPKNLTENNAVLLPRRQRGNSNDRSRMRAEEICYENFNFIPKFEYEYSECNDYKLEIEEWFLYEDNDMFNTVKLQYSNLHPNDWGLSSKEEKELILQSHISQLESDDDALRRTSVACITYIALGNYGHILSTPDHVDQIKANTQYLLKQGALKPLYALLIKQINQKVPENLFSFNESLDDIPGYPHNLLGSIDQELMNTLTIIYFILETNRNDPEFASEIDALDPPLLQFLITAIGRLRWGISGDLPLRNLFLFFWKALMCLFGDSSQMGKVQDFMRQKYNLPAEVDPNEVTASPLDYHAFRQDIISRYPAYIPPSSTLPDTFENTRSMAHYIEIPRPAHAQTSNNSLPVPTVHIATPAPSPPASPAIAAGQKVRKSVFMTNQSFPFIHPTDDSVPQSIIEASELFSTRVRTTPEMVQLWEERDRFMQQERGWVNGKRDSDQTNLPKEKRQEEIILDRIEKLYIDTICQLNSFVLVVLKFILASISFKSSEGHIDTYFSRHQGSSISYRAQEISLKAVSSALELLTSWYKISNVMKFEYLSTLLFDSRYYLLVFKYFYLHTPLESALQIPDDPLQGFFHCTSLLSDIWDNSCPPPKTPAAPMTQGEAQFCEEIKVFSHRYFQSTINLVRVLQRIITGKTQRIIIVAELPPTTLKKALSIYQKDIWEIVLGIFKEEAPFNGRKWKYNNMNLVSAIYLHCKTKLRDDWLISGDVNQEVDDAHSQEIAIRALIQFYNNRLRDEANGTQEHSQLSNRELDFFSLELESLSLDPPIS